MRDGPHGHSSDGDQGRSRLPLAEMDQQSKSFPIVLSPAGAYPVASFNTPVMICSAMPVVNPVITAFDTNPIRDPRRSRPKPAITIPTIRVSVATLCKLVGSSPDCCSTLCEESAIALVN